MALFPTGCSFDERQAHLSLRKLLDLHLPARVGETSVVSTCVHVQDSSRPGEVSAIFGTDAGQTFYHRSAPGEIVHIDVFHSEGYVEPSVVARAVRKALEEISLESDGPEPAYPPSRFVSFVDVQTGVGGGRLDGTLTYGREEGVREAHVTHVHITALNAPEIIASVFAIVNAIESAIESQGLELRKVERVLVGKGTGKLDLSHYRCTADSLLVRPPQQGCLRDHAASARADAIARQVAQDIGSVEDALTVLEALTRGLRPGDLGKLGLKRDIEPDKLAEALVRSHIAKFESPRYSITEDGQAALSYLREHRQEIEAHLRKMLRILPRGCRPKGEVTAPRFGSGEPRGRTRTTRKERGDFGLSLDVPQSVTARGIRLLSTGQEHRFTPDDLRFAEPPDRRSNALLLLIDASASMAGKRIQAAKELCRHLIVAGKDKTAVLVFRDSDAELVVDFTRNPRKLETGLNRVSAQGLTPLSRALEKAYEIASRRLRKPVVLCITDGIPTVPSQTMSPTEDAISAARTFAARRIKFGCVGLEPNRTFLKQLALAARGSLYIVEELEAPRLAAIAKKEITR